LRKKTGLFHLLSINATEDLTRMYKLYKGNEADLEPIAEMFEEFITKEGTAVVDAAKAAQAAPAAKPEEEKKSGDAAGAAPAAAAADVNHALVRNLIGLHAQYNDIVTSQLTICARTLVAFTRFLFGCCSHLLSLLLLVCFCRLFLPDCFEKAQIMQKALKKAFEDFINKDNRVSKLLAKFVNECLKVRTHKHAQFMRTGRGEGCG
jgi:hypothetical protein